jgi:hypothetical protein
VNQNCSSQCVVLQTPEFPTTHPILAPSHATFCETLSAAEKVVCPTTIRVQMLQWLHDQSPQRLGAILSSGRFCFPDEPNIMAQRSVSLRRSDLSDRDRADRVFREVVREETGQSANISRVSKVKAAAAALLLLLVAWIVVCHVLPALSKKEGGNSAKKKNNTRVYSGIQGTHARPADATIIAAVETAGRDLVKAETRRGVSCDPTTAPIIAGDDAHFLSFESVIPPAPQDATFYDPSVPPGGRTNSFDSRTGLLI